MTAPEQVPAGGGAPTGVLWIPGPAKAFNTMGWLEVGNTAGWREVGTITEDGLVHTPAGDDQEPVKAWSASPPTTITPTLWGRYSWGNYRALFRVLPPWASRTKAAYHRRRR